MKKNETFDVTVPFPAWDGIFQINYICSELRHNEMLKGIPVHRTPRRITMKPGVPTEGFDDVKVVEYWFTDGCFAKATLDGKNSHYGTGWTLTSLRLRWKDHFLGLPMAEEKIELRFNTNQLGAIGLASYLRSHMRDYEGLPGLPQAQANLAEASVASDAIVAELAAPIRAAYERQLAWVAALEAEGVHELPANAFDPGSLPAPQVEWRHEK